MHFQQTEGQNDDNGWKLVGDRARTATNRPGDRQERVARGKRDQQFKTADTGFCISFLVES